MKTNAFTIALIRGTNKSIKSGVQDYLTFDGRPKQREFCKTYPLC